ncbi:Alcohol dehydrogenase [NADP(+)] B [Echinococcus granulosus]|uniref:Aldo keto reductase family 1 member B4 n=1 Tax=Echinococcus granulosus TaxID=6210 RepID=A0A068WT71_ECHGR|nr:Alcohol dehydrogenase [NADP(+)] B [Echinococcus granulosus]CDS20878.1 aldo keto reductase family 1 member B4 [Echinococcus granulosus]
MLYTNFYAAADTLMPVFAPLLDLSNGRKIPSIGLGTFKTTDRGLVQQAISAALDAGYRHIDTAFIYSNEAQIGATLKSKMSESGIAREDIFITTKLWGTEHHPQDVRPACEASLRRLQLDYVDLYLLHWPVHLPRECEPRGPFTLEDTWKAMETLVDAGLVRSLGLSNCNRAQIDRILAVARIKPTVLQIEASVGFLNEKLIEYAHSVGLVVTGYAPFGSPGTSPEFPNPLEIPCVVEMAKRHGKTPAQILIRHGIQRDLVVIPKSVTPQRIHENIDVFNFELSADEMSTLNTAEPKQCRRFSLKSWTNMPEYPFHDEF